MGRGRSERSERSSSGWCLASIMQHGAGEILGEEEVAAAAHYEDGLREGVPVQGGKIGLFRYFHK